ncbi:MAG TPA: hypothetical protein VGQ81_05360 [Acidobacteriota bacterium]|jgi:hypothetical protein|nr:hypothetical protein [Acidobacteriota bacterium]
MKRNSWITALACFAVLLFAGQGVAQRAPQKKLPPEGPSSDMRFMTFVTSEMSFDGNVVKGAPYQAQAVSEHVQTLSDGNRIYRNQATAVYRDGEGRTRRDQTVTAIGPWTSSAGEGQVVFINDPVAGFNYVLEVQNRTARKIPGGFFRDAAGHSAHAAVEHTAHAAAEHTAHVEGAVRSSVVVTEGGAPAFHAMGRSFSKPSTRAARKETLGKQVIEGLEAEGTRTVLTIPAGEIGNERAIEIVDERWYSPELQMVVMSKHSDPRMGEDTYRVTNIKRAEPDPSLFQVPSDYNVSQERGMEHGGRVWSGKKPGSKQ